MKYIIKRDGRKKKFDPNKIKTALVKAMVATRNNNPEENTQEAEELTNKIVSKCYAFFKNENPTVEQIQDIVVSTLIESGIVDVSTAYILYREKRSQHRDSQTALMKKIEDITFSDAKESNLKRDNANVDGNTAMGTMLQYGSVVSKQFATDRLLNQEFRDEFVKGNIYPHDLDFLPMGTTTCVSGNTIISIKYPDGLISHIKLCTFDHLFKGEKEGPEIVYLSNLQIYGRNGWTPMVNISRHMRTPEEKYFVLATKKNIAMSITGEHRVPVVRNGKEILIQAKDIMIGDYLYIVDGYSNEDQHMDRPANFKTDEVISIKESDVFEYVYDIETKEHWFIANDYLVHNCLQIPLDKLFKDGFNTGHGTLREPQSIASYASLAAIAIQANQNDQHGGQSIPLLDFYLAPGITKSYIKNIKNNLKIILDFMDKEAGLEAILNDIYAEDDSMFKIKNSSKLIERLSETLNMEDLETLKKMCSKAVKEAIVQTDKQTYQAMEGLVHNLNTMHSRAGAQVPFSSINFGMDTSDEGRMVSKNILLAQEAGLGNGETPIFPILIFQVKEGVNYNPEDPNYDLFKLSMRVSAKRLFPNFVFVDAPFNLQYYDPNDPETIISTMGCVDGDEVITYYYNNDLYVESFARAWERMSAYFDVQKIGESEYINLENVKIYDSITKGFTNCYKLIKNKDAGNWHRLTFSNGRQLLATDDHPLPLINKGRTQVKDIHKGDSVIGVYQQYSMEAYTMSEDTAWLLGVVLTSSSYRKNIHICVDKDRHIENLIGESVKRITKSKVSSEIKKRENGTEYFEFMFTDAKVSQSFESVFNGIDKTERMIPTTFFMTEKKVKNAFISGVIDSCGKKFEDGHIDVKLINKETALQFMLLAQSLGITAEIKEVRNKKKYYIVSFDENIFLSLFDKGIDVADSISETDNKARTNTISVLDNEFIGFRNRVSYDVETESDYFDVSGILSHNCRTRVIGNINGKQSPVGRGNLSFTTINLPRLSIEYGVNFRENGATGYDCQGFYKELDHMINLAIQQLMDRLEIQKHKKVKNFPFLMGQGLWRGSEKLGPNDEIGDILNQGTLSVGFIGLAECLKGLIDKHHGEDDEAQQLGLEIIGHMRQRMDEAIEKYGLNFSLLATPAEGLSGYFTRIDKKRYGIIQGITDRDYYTNSFHVPVYYHISAFDKIKKEGPYHALTNAGHISYVEMDGDPVNNLEAFEAVVRCMKENGVGYGSINHPVDRDPVCGYAGVIEGHICPKCGRDETSHETKELKLKRIKIKGANH